MVEPGTGLIVAMAQSRPVMGGDAKKGETFWNYSVSPALGGAQGSRPVRPSRRSPPRPRWRRASPLGQRYNARATMNFGGARFESCDGTAADRRRLEGQQLHRHQRRDEHEPGRAALGQHLLRPAGAGDRDVPGHRDGREARRQSSTEAAPISSYDDKPSFTLGTVEVNPLSMAEAYATFASGGIHCNPVIVDTITTTRGEELEAPGADCKRVIEQGRRQRDELDAGLRDDPGHRRPCSYR